MASTAARDGRRKDADLQAYQMPASTTLYKETLISARVADGYAYSSRSGTATDIFLGVAMETKTNGAVAGATLLKVWKEGIFVFNASGLAQTDIGAAVYASDNDTVTKTSTNNQLVGYITEVLSASLCRVRINRATQ